MADSATFEDAVPDHRQGRTPVQLSLFLNLDGFEGPIDLLLTLARDFLAAWALAAVSAEPTTRNRDELFLGLRIICELARASVRRLSS
ncbi:MAG: hypothetical protein VYB89_05305, partial [Pseudomonadota bacterium]|nr:hypothetical protein [Pseudomonadota bacterium]